MKTTMHRESQAGTAEPASSSLTFVEKGRAQQEALHVAATKGGLISIRGREVQPKGPLQESGPSPVMEGLLWQISEHVTRRAQVAVYRKEGLSKHDIIKAVWKVEEGPFYEQACAEYEEIVDSLERNV